MLGLCHLLGPMSTWLLRSLKARVVGVLWIGGLSGSFYYELLFGKTPFKGSSGNRATLFNVVVVSFAQRDVIRRLLIKEPQHVQIGL